MAEEFIKIKDGVPAPKGFHYMPNGKLMSDADHVARYGYIEKTIKNFNISTKDISHLGESRSFTIQGDEGAIFSLEIYDDEATPNYYNFNTQTWSTTKSGLYNIEIQGGQYSDSITFPILGFVDATCDYNNDPTIDHDDDNGAIQAGMLVTGTGIPNGATVSSVTSDTRFELSASTTGGSVTNGALRFSKLKTHNVDLRAVTKYNIKTTHRQLVEVRNPDNSININASSGSNSDLLRKLLYQDVKKILHLSAIFPTDEFSSVGTVDNSSVLDPNTTTRIILDQDATNPKIVKVGDHITCSGVADSIGMNVVQINPDGDNVKEIEINIADSISDGDDITFDPALKSTTITNDTITTSTSKDFTTNFTVVCTANGGRTLSSFRTPTINDFCAVKQITFESAALAISGENTSSSSVFYRWPITNIAGLSEGMMLDPGRSSTGTNTTTPASISKYRTTLSSTELDERKYYTDIVTTTLDDVVVPGVDSFSNPITSVDRNGVVTAQKGNIVFNVQQADALKSDANVRILAYGKRQIKDMTGVDIELSNITLTPTQISTTTTAAVNNSTTIPVTDVTNISIASTMRGVNVDSTVANPTVTLKSAYTGAGNLTVSSNQTLESGQTLFFDNASNVITITGTISVKNMALSDTTLYFDIERFLTAS